MNPGRNEPCSCGSGRKFKHCCQGKNEFRPLAGKTDRFDAARAMREAESFRNAGRLREAELLYRQVLQAAPNHAHALNALGVVAFAAGHPAEAEQLVRHAIASNGKIPAFWQNLGGILTTLGRSIEAEEVCRKALQLDRGHAETHNNLGSVLQQQGRFPEAIASYRQALNLKPGHSVIMKNLGALLFAHGDRDEAAALLHKAIELDPNCAEAYSILGSSLQQAGNLAQALEYHQKALRLNPGVAEIHHNIGITLCLIGNFREGVASFVNALRIDPRSASTHGHLIFYLDLIAGYSTADLQAERKKWASLHADPLLQEMKYPNMPDPERILRIGYVSGDFREHSAANGFVSLLGKFDRSKFEVYAYSTSDKIDDTTRLLQQNVTAWRDIHDQSDEEITSLIRRDEIDILVDLSGHTAGNRLLVFARKPAPVQVSAMGYPTGTGMRAMDAILADPIVVPPEEKHLYAEDVRYLPCVIDYSAKRDFPDVNELPALAGEGITFGSFNRFPKLSEETLRLWAQLLSVIPKSRMVLKAGELDDVQVRKSIMRHFENAGISPERIILLGKSSWADHVGACRQVDIALDPFPHGGGVTTIESIMMGVPVLTLRYPTFVGRVSASILTTLGLTGWIAENPEDYVRIAIEKSHDLAALSRLRTELRSVLSSSILGDPDYYLRAAEKEYRVLWQEWCARQAC